MTATSIQGMIGNLKFIFGYKLWATLFACLVAFGLGYISNSAIEPIAEPECVVAPTIEPDE